MDEDNVVLKPKKKHAKKDFTKQEGAIPHRDTGHDDDRVVLKPRKKDIPGLTPRPPPKPPRKAEPRIKPPLKSKDSDIEKRKEISSFGELPSALEEINVPVLIRGMKRLSDRSKKIRPGFSPSWVSPYPPEGAKAVIDYEVDGSKVTLYRLSEEIESSYHVKPMEYDLPLDQVKLLHFAKEHLIERYPRNIQIDNPQQVREYISRLGNRLVYQLARKHGTKLGANRTEEMDNVRKLSEVLAKYTAGFGVIEFFLKDPHVQDIYIDASPSDNRVYIKLGGLNEPRISEKCITNISVGEDDAEGLLSRFRYESGRPFSEAMPVLEMDLAAYKTRVTAIGKPLSPDGIAIAFRRHSTDPWTLLKLIDNGTLTPLAAGLISYLIDGKSTILVVGSRGAGKTSLLGALMLEFPQNQRILTIEDTLELPVARLQEIGYKIQSLSVQSSLGGKAEMSADEALRISLRLGESAIVMGEVRGQEARTLYEAMRAGTAGSSVLGTFHADSPTSVYQRVVHDMQIPPKSFLATDIIIVAGTARPGGSQIQKRKVIQISEVRKNESEENLFQDLLLYDEGQDKLMETDAFNYRSERIGTIAASWNMSLEEGIENILTRAKYREFMVNYARKHKKPQLLSAEWTSKANTAFWNLIEKSRKGAKIDHNKVLEDWIKWFEKSALYA